MALALEQLIVVIPLAPLVGALVNGLLGARLPRRFSGLLACTTVFVSFLASAAVVWHLARYGGVASATLYRWMEVGTFAADVRFVVDALSAVMILVVTGVGFLIHVYSLGYMEHEPAYARYFTYLNLFTFAMLVLVLGDSLPLTFVGWEGVGLCSYLLIGFWYTDIEKAAAGKKAFVVNRIGDFGFLVAMLLLFRATGTLSFAGLANVVAAGHLEAAVATAACLMLVLGATGKSAQLPLYIWLPDAMAGPTPVSALIHAATMVTAGVYLTARLGFLFHLAPTAMLAVATIGAATALFAASIGTAQNDIKKVLAYSTVSQLGFMFIAAGVGAYAAAVAHLVMHAFFKACLFLGAGSVIHGCSGEQDMRQMGGLRKKMPVTFWTFLISTLAITGIVPGLSGFISKDAVLSQAFASGEGEFSYIFYGWSFALWGVGVLAAALTSFYMWRLVFMTFFSGELRLSGEAAHHVHESPRRMTVPLIALALLSLFGGALAWPHVLHGHDLLGRWLAPVLGESPAPEGAHAALEFALMAVSVAAAGLGCAVAYALYGRGIHPFTHRFATERPWRWLYARLFGKWHVDELYAATVVRPLEWVSRVVLYEGVERHVIDATVNAVGGFTRSIGFLVQLLQSGNVQRYLAIFVVGLAVLLYGFLLPSASLELNARASAPSMVAPAVAGTTAPAGGEGY